MDRSIYLKIDETINKALKGLPSLLLFLEPINQQEEKEKFLKNPKVDPKFEYVPNPYEYDEPLKLLEAIEVPDTEIGKVYKDLVNAKIANAQIMKHRGDRQKVGEFSKYLCGTPNLDNLSKAEKLLKDLQYREEVKDVKAPEMKAALEKELQRYVLNEWQVVYENKWLISTNSMKKVITIHKDRTFTKNDLRRLPLHEVGVHALRGENGSLQPYKIFLSGTPDSNVTEEGLTTNFEEMHGLLDENLLRNYAGRFAAVNALIEGKAFHETFEILKEFKFSDDDAWTITTRVYRGGGLIKDHIYFDGYLKVKEYLKEKPDLKTLYVGKISIENLPIAHKLLDENEIQTAKHLPDFIE